MNPGIISQISAYAIHQQLTGTNAALRFYIPLDMSHLVKEVIIEAVNLIPRIGTWRVLANKKLRFTPITLKIKGQITVHLKNYH